MTLKKINSIFDTESKIIHFMGSNKYIITKIKCWPTEGQKWGYPNADIPPCNWSHNGMGKFFWGTGTKTLTFLERIMLEKDKKNAYFGEEE